MIRFLLVVLCNMVLCTSSSGINHSNKYEIYQPGNNYSRPVTAVDENGDHYIYGMSGIHGGYIIKFDNNAEVVREGQKWFEYESNADIKQFKGKNSKYFLCVSSIEGDNDHYKVIFTDTKIWTTEKGPKTSSFKVALTPLESGDMLVNWAESISQYWHKIVVSYQVFDENTKKLTEIYNITWETDNKYISCIEMKNTDIICQYVGNSCTEKFKIFSKALKEKSSHDLIGSADCGFDKLIQVSNIHAVFTYLTTLGELKAIVKQYDENGLKHLIDSTSLMSGCDINTRRVDTSAFNENTFIGTCIVEVEKINRVKAVIATINFNKKEITLKEFLCSGKNADYPFASKFGKNFLSVFYNSNGDNVYEIMEVPFCKGFTVSIFRNSKSVNFNVGSYVTKGSGDNSTSNDKLKVIFPEKPPLGLVILAEDDTEVIYGDGTAERPYHPYEPTLTYFKSFGVLSGNATMKFAGYNIYGQVGKWCLVTFQVKACYDSCYTCSEQGNANDNKCESSCVDNSDSSTCHQCLPGYSPIYGKPGFCSNSVDKYYNDTSSGNDGEWKPCADPCASCYKGPEEGKHNCDKCVEDHHKYEGDTGNNCVTEKEGFYLDGDVLRPCFSTCASCTTGGTETANNCNSCKPGTYEFQNIPGKCDSADTSSNGNYYLNNDTHTWQLCYDTCKTCSKGGDANEHHCDTCIDSHKKVEGTTNCVGSLPPLHYDDGEMYRKCDEACQTCKGPANDITTNCYICYSDNNKKYHPFYPDTSNCALTKPDDHFIFTDGGVEHYRKCYDTCATCHQLGDVSQHNCDTCIEGYFPIESKPTQCVQDQDKHYLDTSTADPLNPMFRPCHVACVDCLGPSSTATTNCNETLCADGYHPVLTDKTNCLDVVPEGFYLAPPAADDGIQYITPCYDTCKKCSTKGNEDDHKCNECKDTYFKVEGTNWNCWNDGTKDGDYYLDSSNPDNKIYRKCYDRCATCQKGFTQDSHNCDTCIENHYFKHDTKDCAFSKDPTADEYFGNKTAHYLERNPTDDKLSVWKPCHTTCQTCSNGLDGDNHNCDSCIAGYKFIYDTKNCVDQPPQYYYDDTSSIYFKPCHESCETCKGSEREDCIICRYTDFYYPTEETLLDETKRCYNGSKDHDNSPGDDYYLDKNENEIEGVYRKCWTHCATCSKGGDDTHNNCDSCKEEVVDGTTVKYYPYDTIEGSCVHDPPSHYLDPDSETYKQCHPNCNTCAKEGTNTKQACLTCHDGVQSEGYTDTDDGQSYLNCLVTCPEADQYYWQGQCADCPEGTLTEEGNIYCINCKDNNTYHIEGVATCQSDIPSDTYLENGDLNYYKKCDENCLTCKKPGNYCLTCTDDKFIHEDTVAGNSTCVEECPGNLHGYNKKCQECGDKLAIEGKVCVSCAPDRYKPINETSCVAAQLPEGTIIVDEQYNVFDYCHERCSTCSKPWKEGNTEMFCSSCKSTFNDGDNYLERSPSTDCVDNCETGLVNEKGSQKCINCREDKQPPMFKLEGTKDQCLEYKPDIGFKWIEESKNYFKMCYETCETCNEIGDVNEHKCTFCKQGYYMEYVLTETDGQYTGSLTTNCIQNCTNNLYHDKSKRECVNCKGVGNGQYKYLFEDKCIEIKPSNTIITEDKYNIIQQCHTRCATCNALPSQNDEGKEIHNCLTCNKPYYLQKEYPNCEDTCEVKYVIDDHVNKCMNCKIDYEPKEQYKFPDENYCHATQPNGGYIDTENGNNDGDYNLLTRCPGGCSTCGKKEGVSTISNEDGTTSTTTTNGVGCDDCAPGYFLEYKPTNGIAKCFSSEEGCGNNLVADRDVNKCINCADATGEADNKFVNNNTCVVQPPRTYVVDEVFGIIAWCLQNCEVCQGGFNDTVQNCTECKKGLYLGHNDTNCYNVCGSHLVSDEAQGKCINCQKTGQYKYPEKNQCEDVRPPNSFIIDQEFNVYQYCYKTCATCDKGPEQDDTIHNCKTCKPNYYHDFNIHENCVDNCGVNYGIDQTTQQCVNCKTFYIPEQYKIETQKECITKENKPENMFIKDPEMNILGKCPIECKTCESETKCTSCIDGYILQEAFGQCVEKCNIQGYWYLDDEGYYKCAMTCDEITEDRGVIEPVQRQCVKNCNSELKESTCLQCEENILYEYKGQCISECPPGYIANIETYECEYIEFEEESSCIDTLFQTEKKKLQDIEKLINDTTDDYRKNYRHDKDNRQVDIYVGENYTIHLFKTDACQYETSIKHGLSYVNFTECELKLIEHYSPKIEKGDIIFVKVDTNRTEENTNQVTFKAFDQQNRNELDLSICGDIPIQYPLSNKIDLSMGALLDEWGYDIFDPNDKFYNDFCTPYYTKDGKDVVMVDRRADFFNNYTFCNEGCQYSKMNFKTARVECKCDVNTVTVGDDNNRVKQNKPQSGFQKLKITANNFIVIRCYNLVFNWPYMKRNIGSWIILVYFVFQIPGIFNFIFIGLRPVYSYLNRFSTQKTLGNNDVQAIANPPVKKKETTKKKDIKHVDTTEGDEFKIDTQGHNYTNDFNETSSTRKKLPLYELDSRNNFMLSAKLDIGNDKYVVRPKQKKKRTEKKDYEEKPELEPHEKEEEETEEEDDDDDEEEPEFDDDNMDDMIYEDAVKYDDRSFGTMLIRNIKQKLFFTGPFMSINVLEPFFVRLLTFFLLLALYYTLNGFFFHEAYISNRYGSKGNTGFTYFVKNELPRCLLAGLVGTVVSALIMIFAFSRRRFMTAIEEEKTHEGFMRRTQKMMRCLKIRLVIFVIVDILVMFFCWYYVSAFGAVYQQSQIPLLIGMAVTVVFVLIFQILYALIVCLMRYIGLKCKCICLYTVSTYLL